MAKKTSSIQKSLDFIADKIRNLIWKTGERLPPISTLAAEIDVSPSTLYKAIEILSTKGLVSIYPKKGVYAGKVDFPKRTVPAKKPRILRVEELRLKLTQEIVEGTFDATGFLPTSKELVHRFGANFQTIKTVLDTLIADKRISRYKRRYSIVRSKPQNYSNSIFFIHGPLFYDQLVYDYFRSRAIIFFHHLHKQCSDRKIHLRARPYTTRFESHEGFENAQGFILWINYAVADIITYLVSFKKPIFIFNDFYQEIPRSVQDNRYVHVVCLADFLGGYSIGKHLVDNGHKKVCYVTTGNTTWGKQRFDGFLSAFRQAGLPETSVEKVIYKTPEEQNMQQPTKRSGSNILQQVTDSIAQVSHLINAATTTITNKSVNQSVVSQLQNVIYAQKHRMILMALINSFLEKGDYTALVGEEDSQALVCKELLERTGVRIPHNVSVIGFNNEIESMVSGLTSYDFNMPAIVGKIMDTMFWPQKKNSGKQNPVVEVEGFIAQRGSTGQAQEIVVRI